MQEYRLELKDIVKRFPPLTVNDHVNIQVKKGEIYALLGENGAGKSTLMSILAGMYQPDSGEIRLNGKPCTIPSPRKAAELGIGMVHQHFKLVSEFTAAENIVMGMEPHKKVLGLFPYVDLKAATEEVGRLSEEYGLQIDPEMKIRDADVYIRQRVEILKMLYRNADILIFDEPTAMLAPQEIQRLLEIIRGLKAKGKTILLITHKLDEIRQTADRCAILRRGKVTGVLDAKEASTEQMAELMVGQRIESDVLEKTGKFGPEVLWVDHICTEGATEKLDQVSFCIHQGEIFAVAGVAGNGQTAIAEAVSGSLGIVKGRIWLNKEEISDRSVRERNLLGISYIPGDRHRDGVILDFTLEENMALKNYFRPEFSNKGFLSLKRLETHTRRFIERYDIRCTRGGKTVVRSMSGGNQQKAVIAREIEQNGDLLIFVQPTRGLDIGAVERIHRQMFEEKEKGKAILLISMELEEIKSCADTIGVLYNGKIIRTAPAERLTENDIGRYMMGQKGGASDEDPDLQSDGK